MTHPDQPEKKEPCRMCDGVGGAIEGCPCSRCEGARRHDRHTASEAPKTMGEGPCRVELAWVKREGSRGALILGEEHFMWCDEWEAAEGFAMVINSHVRRLLSSLSQERDEMKEKAGMADRFAEEIVTGAKVGHEYGSCDPQSETGGITCRGWEDHISPAMKEALAAYAKAGKV